jgi:hypothetical protein
MIYEGYCHLVQEDVECGCPVVQCLLAYIAIIVFTFVIFFHFILVAIAILNLTFYL